MNKELRERVMERLELMEAHSSWQARFYREDVRALLDYILAQEQEAYETNEEQDSESFHIYGRSDL